MIKTVSAGIVNIKGSVGDLFLELSGIISAYRNEMAVIFGEEKALQLVVLAGRMSMAEKDDDEAEGKRIMDEAAELMANAIKEGPDEIIKF